MRPACFEKVARWPGPGLSFFPEICSMEQEDLYDLPKNPQVFSLWDVRHK